MIEDHDGLSDIGVINFFRAVRGWKEDGTLYEMLFGLIGLSFLSYILIFIIRVVQGEGVFYSLFTSILFAFYFFIFFGASTVLYFFFRVLSSTQEHVTHRKMLVLQEEQRIEEERVLEESRKLEAENEAIRIKKEEEDRKRRFENKEEEKKKKREYLEETISDTFEVMLKELKTYSYALSTQLQELVQQKKITVYDRQVVIQKIDQENNSFKKKLLQEKDQMLEKAQTPQEYLKKELQALEKIKKYHTSFLEELEHINMLGIHDKAERLYKKRLAEEDYNDLRNQVFSSVAVLPDVFFILRTEDDELVHEVSNDDFY